MHKKLIIFIGSEALNELYRIQDKNIFLGDCEYVAISTNRQALDSCSASKKLILESISGEKNKKTYTPDFYRQAMLANIDFLKDITQSKGYKAYIITALGGDTGAGAAPVVADFLQQKLIPVVSIGIYPFFFEEKERKAIANKGQSELEKYTDKQYILKNDTLLSLASSSSISESFKLITSQIIEIIKEDKIENEEHDKKYI